MLTPWRLRRQFSSSLCQPLQIAKLAVLLGIAVATARPSIAEVQSDLKVGQLSAEKPNILIILADDLGFNQIGAYGDTPIRTPNLDQLAARGIQFTDAYAGSTVCSPSRVSLFTGRDGRLLKDNSNQVELTPIDVIIPAVLKHAGYDTALFGKYSIGGQMGVTDPISMGFDTWFGMYNILEGHRQYPRLLWRDNQPVRVRENEAGRQESYAQELFTNEAINYVSADRSNPFFVVLAYSSPHAELAAPARYCKPYEDELPIKPYLGMSTESPPEFARYYPTPVPHPHATLAGMVSALDDYVGQLIQALERKGIAENTLVFVTSDNGPHREGGADPEFFRAAAPHRGIKRDLYDGGIRVPMICVWPSRITEPRIDRVPWAFADFLPTLAQIAGVDLKSVPRLETNGTSIAGLLRDNPIAMKSRTLYWEFAAQLGDPNSGITGQVHQAARRDQWKAVRLGADSPVEIYDLASDPSEHHDLADEHPELLREFTALFDNYN